VSPEPAQTSNHITVLNEKPLHADLKAWYARPGDRQEVMVDGYFVDIVRGELLVEIQTRNFSSIRRKLRTLSGEHHVRLVHPIAHEKWIVREAPDGSVLGRRKSPKRGLVEEVFHELVSVPDLVTCPGFSLEVLLTREEESRRQGRRRWRGQGWVTRERRLIEVIGSSLIRGTEDLAALLPSGLAEPFTTAGLAAALGRPRQLAQRMAYCLRAVGVIGQVGKRGNAVLYARRSQSGGG
jgi:hypothetical protein